MATGLRKWWGWGLGAVWGVPIDKVRYEGQKWAANGAKSVARQPRRAIGWSMWLWSFPYGNMGQLWPDLFVGPSLLGVPRGTGGG